MGTRPAKVPELILVAEAGIPGLFPGGGAGRMEASGVLVVDDEFLVVFDDSRNIGVVSADLAAPGGNRIITVAGKPEVVPWDGYEDIARDPVTGLLYLLVEAAEREDGSWMAKIEVCDKDYHRVSEHWLPFGVPDAGKGMEGLAFVRRGRDLFLLAICEGNNCQGGKAGRKPGGGRIQVFGHGGGSQGRDWAHVTTIELPDHLWFTDHAGISILDDRIAVVSQESSALWIGRYSAVDWRITDPGKVYEFPRDAKGRAVYCMVEGVSWLDDRRLVACSDRAKSSTPGRCRDKQQSVHIFALPV